MEKICYKCENYPICNQCLNKSENFCSHYDERLPRNWLNEEALISVERYENALQVIKQEFGIDAADYTQDLYEKLVDIETRWQFMDIISNAVEAGVCSRL